MGVFVEIGVGVLVGVGVGVSVGVGVGMSVGVGVGVSVGVSVGVRAAAGGAGADWLHASSRTAATEHKDTMQAVSLIETGNINGLPRCLSRHPRLSVNLLVWGRSALRNH